MSQLAKRLPIGSIRAAVALLLLGAWFGLGCAGRTSRPVQSVIEPEAFVASRGSADAARAAIVLDVRDAAAYRAGHVQGAINADAAAWKEASQASNTGLDQDHYWKARIAELGIDRDSPVIVYDDGRMTEAARVWFILQHFGVRDAAVLNGGYRALESQRAASAAELPATAASPGSIGSMSRSPGPVELLDRAEMLDTIRRGEAQVLDARTPDEFAGKVRHKNPRGGRLPKSVSLPHKKLLDENGRLKSPDALAVHFRDAGFERGKPLVTYCESGGRASLAALAATRAGYGPVLNYYLSFSEWSADLTCPVETE